MRTLSAITVIDSARAALSRLTNDGEHEAAPMLALALHYAANDTRTLVLALREVALRLPSGNPTRILVMDALASVGVNDPEPPPEGRSVSLIESKQHGH
jgi:hypothetical protein